MVRERGESPIQWELDFGRQFLGGSLLESAETAIPEHLVGLLPKHWIQEALEDEVGQQIPGRCIKCLDQNQFVDNPLLQAGERTFESQEALIDPLLLLDSNVLRPLHASDSNSGTSIDVMAETLLMECSRLCDVEGSCAIRGDRTPHQRMKRSRIPPVLTSCYLALGTLGGE